MKELWARLEAWANAHGASLRLRGGVSEADLAAAEEKMRLVFPADLRASMSAHDGQEDADDCFSFLPGCAELRPLSAIVARWEEETRLATDDEGVSEDGLVHMDIWNPRRIPIAGNRWW